LKTHIELLNEALTEPGKLMAAYTAFHRYSMGNQLLAMMQGANSPINTYKGWQSLGRQVKKGSKAIELCMPVTITKEQEGDKDDVTFTRFIYRRNWFTLDQTDGDEFTMPKVPDFDLDQVLKTFNIERISFNHTDGNVQGYAQGRKIAINPLAQLPFKTAIHEIAHIIHGHTDVTVHDTYTLPRDIQELEAEGTAYLVIASLGLEGAEYCRGYIQNWVKDISEESAKKIIAKADAILKAGTTTKTEKETL
jgi:hypothetical protein